VCAGAAIALALAASALGGCAIGRASEVEMRTARGEMVKVKLPRGYPRVMVDPTDTMVAWLDLGYASDPKAPPKLQSLDVISPKSVLEALVARADGATEEEAPLGRRPIVVFIHGGTWSGGDKRGGLELKSTRLLGAGFLLASINYRLSPDWKHPAHVEDTAAAIAWLHEQGSKFGGAPDRFVLVGHSAGAHLAALVATDERWLAKHGLPLSILAGVVSLDGAGYDLPDRTMGEIMSERTLESVFGRDRAVWADASPVNHVAPGKGIPPFLLFHAGDREISLQETAKFSAALAKAGLSFEVVHAAEKTHRTIHLDFGKDGDAVTNRFLEFALRVTQTAAPAAP
jgi:acetyl esterase/lipase